MRLRSSGSTMASTGSWRVRSSDRRAAVNRKPSKLLAAALTMTRSTGPPALILAFSGSLSMTGRCSTPSSAATRWAWRSLSSTIRTRPPRPSRRAAAPAITPMRRPEASRWRSSSITSLKRVRLRTRANSMTSSIGLVRKSEAPDSRPWMRSPRPSSAVISTTGMWRVTGSSLSFRQTVKPSMPGIMTSSRIMSGRSRAAMARAVGPSIAVETS